MKKLVAGVAALVTMGVAGSFGVRTASADDTPTGGAPAPAADGTALGTAYALGGERLAELLDRYGRRRYRP